MTSSNRQLLVDQLRRTAMFGDVSEDVLLRIVNGSKVRDYPRGQTLFMIGDTSEHCYFVVTGSIELSFISGDGAEVILTEIQPGDLLGEIELTLECHHATTAVVVAATRLIEINRKTFAELNRVPQISAYVMRNLARKLHSALQFAEGLALHPIETRLARLLLDMGAIYGRTMGDGILIERSISQSHMGRLINASRPRVNAQLQSWKNANLIGVEQNRIVILNRSSLQAISRLSDRTG